MKGVLQGLNAEGKTIFLTTHDMDEANQLCDRAAIINKGSMVAIDAPEKLRMAMSGMHSVEVSFDNAVSPEALANVPGVNTVKKLGDKWRLYTTNPGELVVSLANYSSSHGLNVISLSMLAPSLEDAFVALTEKEARDAWYGAGMATGAAFSCHSSQGRAYLLRQGTGNNLWGSLPRVPVSVLHHREEPVG
jgi:ABC-2 type transport system ATP-binding protein